MRSLLPVVHLARALGQGTRLAMTKRWAQTGHIQPKERVLSLLGGLLSAPTSPRPLAAASRLEDKVKEIVCVYKDLEKEDKEEILKILSKDFSVSKDDVTKALNRLKDRSLDNEESGGGRKARQELRSALTPRYLSLFKNIARLDCGVKTLVDLRCDLLDLIGKVDNRSELHGPLHELNLSLKELLSLFFSVGFLTLERVTWSSSCDMLQKISEYEGVHPVRSWTDLKRRVGPYRRCYVYTHRSMPGEPLVVLHTALLREVASSTAGLVHRPLPGSQRAGREELGDQDAKVEEDPELARAAIFYSITSTQRGLQGIELGNYLIKRVVREVQAEFPKVSIFSTLSPIPGFRSWLFERLKAYEQGEIEGGERWKEGVEVAGGSWKGLRKCLLDNSWLKNECLVSLLQPLLITLCAQYLYKEKRRGSALCSVANFHSKNGAVMWRLNWLADISPRGLTNSLGIMVNYRYYLEDLEKNSEAYIERKVLNASDEIVRLAEGRLLSKL